MPHPLGLYTRPQAAAAAGGGTPPVAGYAGWWDASDTSSITIATGVSQWNDKSGNGFHVSQGTGGNQPASGSTINGLNVITFDGSNDYLTRATTPTWSAASLTTFVVMNMATTGTFQIIFEDAAAANSFPNIRSTDYLYAATNGNILYDTNPTTGYGLHCFSVVNNGAGTNTGTIYRDGTQIGIGDVQASSIAGLNVGARGGSFPANGPIAEIIAYTSALGTTDRQSVEAYLKAKWGTP